VTSEQPTELRSASFVRSSGPLPSASGALAAPSSTWRTFLEAHIDEIVAIDFVVVPTLHFQLLFGFLILRHDRQELVHVNATDHLSFAKTLPAAKRLIS
jgi:hypothetical protein